MAQRNVGVLVTYQLLLKHHPVSAANSLTLLIPLLMTKIVNYSKRAVDQLGYSYLAVDHQSRSESSYSTLTHRVDLRSQNPYRLYHYAVTRWHRDLYSYPPDLYFGYWLPPGFDLEAVYNRARAKWYGKLRKGSASLGVTAASWRESRDMIIQRSRKLSDALDYAIRSADRRRKIRRQVNGRTRYLQRNAYFRGRTKDPIANAVLETEFGWMPLFQDIHAALSTVCGDIPPTYITSRHREVVHRSVENLGSAQSYEQTWSGWCRVSLAATAVPTNPNAVLLNRLGLINPATVVWDLIPWSFVVNMFLNVNELVSSITDEVGYDIGNRSRTDTVNTLTDVTAWRYNLSDNYGWSSASVNRKYKVRSRVTDFAPSWQVKVPDLNWELAAIATSLVVQKFKKLNRLLSL